MSTPLDRATSRSEELLSGMGMTTTASPSPLGNMVTASRSNYPHELQVHLIETARGVAVKVKFVAWLKVFLAHIPFAIVGLYLMIQWKWQFPVILGDVNLNKLWFGNADKLFLGVALLVVYVLFASLEYLAVRIRASFVRRRLALHLVGADWQPAEPSMTLDAVVATSPIIWVAWLVASLFYFPLALPGSTQTDFINVYDATMEQVMAAIRSIIAIFVSAFAGFLASARLSAVLKYKLEVDPHQVQEELTENQLAQMASYGAVSGATLVFVSAVTFAPIYLDGGSALLVAVSMSIVMITATSGMVISHFGRGWPHGASVLWLFFTTLWMIFENSDNPGYSWPIIAGLFILPVPLIFGGHYLLEKFAQRHGVYEPSWLYVLFPISAMIAAVIAKFRKKPVSMVREKEEQKIEKLRIPLDAIRSKGPRAVEIVTLFAQISTFLKDKSEPAYASLDPDLVAKRVDAKLKDYAALRKEATSFIRDTDRLIWDPRYSIEKQQSKTLIGIGKRLLEALAKED